MGATFARSRTFVDGETLTASNLNGVETNLLNNFTPAGMDDYSATAVEMRVVTDPYPALAESLATSSQGEIERIRYILAQITGRTYWYQDIYPIMAEGAAVASATTCDIWAAYDGATKHITGTTTIESLGTAPQAGAWLKIIFDGILTLTHGANLNLPGSANITTAANDFAFVYADTTTLFRVLYFRADGTAASGSTAKWTALTATTDFSTTAASTSTITMSTDQTANILVGYAIKFTLSGTVYYAQVTAITSNLMTIRGAPLTTGAGNLTALSYSTLPSQVEVIDLSVDGYYEDATDSTLILSDMRKRLVWEESKAYVVGWDMSQRTVDTGTEANVTVMVNAAAVGTANTNQGPTMSGTADTVVSTVVDINTSNYDINRGELLDVQVTKAGNGNAVDMTLLMTVVYP